jgi:L-ascorbate metabolism protein UlaG (beta-lactamase superfamily)
MAARGVLRRVATITRVTAHASWFLVRAGELVVNIDPHLARGSHDIDVAPEAREQADLVLVTHPDIELCQPEVVGPLLGPGTIVVAPHKCDQVLQVDHLVATPGETIDVAGFSLEVVHAYAVAHPGLLEHARHRKGEGVGYVLTLAGRRIYHAGASDFIPEMRALKAIDVALLPIGGGFMRGAGEAVAAALAIAPRVVIPMYEDDRGVETFKREVESRSPVRVVPLRAGESYALEESAGT